MKNLKIEHVAPYLPYALKVLSGDSKAVYELSGIKIRDGWINYERKIEINGENSPRYYTQEIKYCKPLLYPLSCLTKEIEVNGEIFIPIIELTKIEDSQFNRELEINNGAYSRLKYLDNEGAIYYLAYYKKYNSFMFMDAKGTALEMLYTYKLYQKLLEWHFDINDLILYGLAIDKSTI